MTARWDGIHPPDIDPATYDADFRRWLASAERFEGGWADHAGDKGGRTRFGISSKSYPKLDLSTLTREQAAAIFWLDFWGAVHGSELGWPLNFCAADWAIHSGPGEPAKALQRILRGGLVVDGDIGEKTLARLRKVAEARSLHDLADRLLEERVSFLARGIQRGWFTQAGQDRTWPLHGFWQRTVRVAIEMHS